MTAAVLLLLGISAGTGTLATLLAQAVIHHHAEVAGVLLAAAAWVVAHIPSRTVRTLCAPHTGKHTRRQVAARPAEARKEVTA